MREIYVPTETTDDDLFKSGINSGINFDTSVMNEMMARYEKHEPKYHHKNEYKKDERGDHMVKDCEQPYKCGEEGQMSKDCETEPKTHTDQNEDHDEYEYEEVSSYKYSRLFLN